MSSERVPDADADNTPGAIRNLNINGQAEDPRESQGAGKPSRHIPTREECLAALAKLPGLIAMKVLSPGAANAIRASYETLLKEYGKAPNGPSGHFSDEDVMSMFRSHPEMLSLIESLLTQDQIDMVIKSMATK